jgi:hypothetical protein
MFHTSYLPKAVLTQFKKCVPSFIYKPIQSALSKHSIVRRIPKIDASNHSPNVSYYDFELICSQILTLLKTFHIQSTRSFLYVSVDAYNIGKQCFLNIIHHVLDFIDAIPVHIFLVTLIFIVLYLKWVYRNTYYSILYYSLRRGEFHSATCCLTKLNSSNAFTFHVFYTNKNFVSLKIQVP